ncbi:18555_t:CDS:2, partial [Acaulospora morrowiae]
MYGAHHQNTSGSYTAAPPEYSQAPSSSREPLVGGEWDVPDDFKHGVTVFECDISVRMAFVRKVYSILFAQLAATTVVAGIMMYNEKIKFWVHDNSWAMILSAILTFVLLFALFWKRRSHPLNLQLLAAFTLLESYSIGNLVTYFDQAVVLQALVITTGVFIGLTLFTMQSKYDFSGMFPILYVGLWVVVIIGLVGIFIPFSKSFDLIIAVGTAILFCGFIVYDTFVIMKRLNPEEYIIAAVELYLDFINLFISILRILNDLN